MVDGNQHGIVLHCVWGRKNYVYIASSMNFLSVMALKHVLHSEVILL